VNILVGLHYKKFFFKFLISKIFFHTRKYYAEKNDKNLQFAIFYAVKLFKNYRSRYKQSIRATLEYLKKSFRHSAPHKTFEEFSYQINFFILYVTVLFLASKFTNQLGLDYLNVINQLYKLKKRTSKFLQSSSFPIKKILDVKHDRLSGQVTNFVRVFKSARSHSSVKASLTSLNDFPHIVNLLERVVLKKKWW